MPAPLLRADGLRVSLEDTPILHDLSFEIPAGGWTGLVGPNGSGKTTLLRAASGVLPYRGTLELDGRPLRAWPARALARRLAFMRQTHALAFDFNVLDLVLLGRAPHKGWLEGTSRGDVDRARRALAEMELEGFEARSVLSLSGGELQRVFLAQALVQEADVLLLDEPTTHLDVHHQFGLLERVRRLVAEGRTVVAVFHDLELAARFADRLLVLHRGRLAAAGPPRDVLTPTLLADVFRMDAAVAPDADGRLRVHYHQPT